MTVETEFQDNIEELEAGGQKTILTTVLLVCRCCSEHYGRRFEFLVDPPKATNSVMIGAMIAHFVGKKCDVCGHGKFKSVDPGHAKKYLIMHEQWKEENET